MGTTLTLAVSHGADLVVVHVGDSRAYLLRQGRLVQLTRDHTIAQALADSGAIPAAEAATHRLRHVLTNVLGGEGMRASRTSASCGWWTATSSCSARTG